jgi:hypothetical protein
MLKKLTIIMGLILSFCLSLGIYYYAIPTYDQLLIDIEKEELNLISIKNDKIYEKYSKEEKAEAIKKQKLYNVYGTSIPLEINQQKMFPLRVYQEITAFIDNDNYSKKKKKKTKTVEIDFFIIILSFVIGFLAPSFLYQKKNNQSINEADNNENNEMIKDNK